MGFDKLGKFAHTFLAFFVLFEFFSVVTEGKALGNKCKHRSHVHRLLSPISFFC